MAENTKSAGKIVVQRYSKAENFSYSILVAKWFNGILVVSAHCKMYVVDNVLSQCNVYVLYFKENPIPHRFNTAET